MPQNQPLRQLKKRFRQRHARAVKSIRWQHGKALKLLKETEVPIDELGVATARMLGAGTLSGALLLSPVNQSRLPEPATTNKAPQSNKQPIPDKQTTKPLPPARIEPNTKAESGRGKTNKKVLVRSLQKVLPKDSGSGGKKDKLTDKQMQRVAKIVNNTLSVRTTNELEGFSLPADYGLIGYEQHLRRYPGDTILEHEAQQQVGMAPRNGAWGYFAQNKKQLTEKDILREKYYLAVQTFRSSNWQESVYKSKDWFKYRKMLVINVKTGDAVVGVVADAGPATWTGKQFGGSPEVMRELRLDRGARKGEVLVLFIKDPDDKVALGPLN